LYIVKFKDYCISHSINFPNVTDSDIAVYLTNLASTTTRPKSSVYGTLAALNAFYEAMEYNPISSDVRRLAEGIVKSGTSTPMNKSTVLPIQPFMSLFQAWPSNDNLSLKFLRMKAICLLALTFMLRPSDIAPRSVIINSLDGQQSRIIFSVDNITFTPDGGMEIVFHGIKNDYDRDGFTVRLPDLEGRPVFLTLTSPFSAIDSKTVSKVLSECISLAGLAGRGFTAKSFRPTGATCAIDSGINPETARHIGRWRCSDTFFKHYVHSKVPSDYVSKLLEHS
jgi:hypothetical protein